MGRKNKSDLKKPEIVQYAYNAVRDHGIDGATLSTIASYMEGHKSLLTYYFKAKEDLIIALVDSTIEKYESFYYTSMKGVEDCHKRYKKIIDILFSQEFNEEVDYKVIYSCLYLSFFNKKIKVKVKKMFKRFIDALESELTAFVKEDIITQKDPHETAVYLVSLVEGFGLLYNSMGDSFNFKKNGTCFKKQVMQYLEN